MRVRMNVFYEPKRDTALWYWEDKAVCRRVDAGTLRFLVLDGASEAFDAVRWVQQIADSYLSDPVGRPELHDADMGAWFHHLQEEWAASPPQFQNLMEERKFHQTGSFATMLAGSVTGLDGPHARWDARSLGDTVLFHVRDGELHTHFPPMTDAAFDRPPRGVSTRPAKLPEMMDELQVQSEQIRDGDLLLVATDALARWMLRFVDRDGPGALFGLLGALDHPELFAAFVADRREAGELVDDDVTLLRLRFSAADPSHLVVCL